MAERGEEADKLYHHDQRPGRRGMTRVAVGAFSAMVVGG
jgi:hypothetical protein